MMNEVKSGGFLEKFFKYPALIAGSIGIITVFFALWIPRAELDNNNLRFVPASDEARLVSKYIDDTFGSSLFILVGLERKYGSVFDSEFLHRLREYTRRLEEELTIIGKVNSLVTADYIAGDGDSIVVENLAPSNFTGTEDEIALLKRRVLSWDIYRRALVSDDFTATQVLVPLDIPEEDAGKSEVADSYIRVRDIAEEMFQDYAEVYVTGIPVISAAVSEAMRKDLALMIPLVMAAVLLVLFFSFRRLTPVVLPLLTVAVAVIWSVGAMPLFGIQLSVVSSVLPVILVAVGSAYGIHVLTHYLEDTGERVLDAGEHRALVFSLLRKTVKPVFLAALTTFAGFVSFCFTSVLPIREFGVFSSFGVIVSFFTAVTLIPALLLIRGPRHIKPLASSAGKNIGEDRLSVAMAGFFFAICRRKGPVLGLGICLTLISFYGVSRLILDNVLVEYFKSDSDIARSDRFIREKFGGSKVVSVVAQAESAEILLSPATLGAMDDLNRFLETRVPLVGKVMGFTDMVKRTNQVFNADESPRGIPARLAAENSAEQSFGFGGFGDGVDEPGFGFGGFEDGANGPGFGFGGFGDGADGPDFDFTALDPDADGREAGGRAEDRVYTVMEILGLLDQAAASSQSPDLNAAQLVWELKKLVNYQGTSYYEIPRIPQRYGKSGDEELQGLISNYLVFLSGSIDPYANDPLEPTAIKTTVQLRTLGEEDTSAAIQEIHRFTAFNFPPEVKVIVGGSALVEASLNRLVVNSQLISVLCSLLIVFVILSVSNRSPVAGIIGIAPLSLSILINFAVMGFLGIKLNIGTSMIASVSVGIGIDYTIHYLETFKREYRAGGGNEFLKTTFAVSGKAIMINAISVGAGFGVLLFSQFVMLRHFGFLIALTMITSALVSLTILPVLLLIFKPRFIEASKNA